jgi:hypothetical protein
MVMHQLVTTTSQEGLHAVGTSGQTANSAYDQLSRYLAQQLSAEHARLLAEPNLNPSRGLIDWYSEAEGPARAFAELDEAARRGADDRLARLVNDVLAEGDELAKSKDGGKRLLGQMLKLAVEVPSEDYIYAVGDQPVLVCWGNLRDVANPPTGLLRKMAYRPPPPPPPVPPSRPAVAPATVVAVAVRAWSPVPLLLWLLFSLLVATIFYMLLAACAMNLPSFARGIMAPLMVNCGLAATVDDDGELAAESAKQAVLRDELRRRQLEVARAQSACQVPEIRTEIIGDPADPDSEFDERLERAGARSGAVTVTLMWDSNADLDLYVTCPGGEVISYGNGQACQGELDVDMNHGPNHSKRPVENVVWPEAAPGGTYQISVRRPSAREDDSQPTPYRVRVSMNGETTIHEGEVSSDGTLPPPIEFEVP